MQLNKKKPSRVIAWLMTLMIVLTILPVSVFADEGGADYTLYYNSSNGKMYKEQDYTTEVTNEEVPAWSGNGTTLTLNGINFSTTAATALDMPEGTTIRLAENSINTLISTNEKVYSSGLKVSGAVTITGDTGILNATGTYAGISANAHLTINGGIITAIGIKEYGIGCYDNGLSIIGGTVTAIGGNLAIPVSPQPMPTTYEYEYNNAATAEGATKADNTNPPGWQQWESARYFKFIAPSTDPDVGGSDTYTVTYDANTTTNGTVPIDSNSPYDNGATVTVLGNTGSLDKTDHIFAGWNTAADGSGTDYIAEDMFTITADMTLYAQWISNSGSIYTVTYDANTATNGTVPTDSSSPYDDGATVTVLGNTGSLDKTDYIFAGWNTASDGGGTNYAAGDTFTISEDMTLYAQWTDNSGDVTKIITATAGTGGTISPSGSVMVNEGSNQTFTITANSGYSISRVTVDGVNQGAISTYTFSNVTANHTISAVFSYNGSGSGSGGGNSTTYYGITIKKDGDGNGSVTTSPSNPSSGSRVRITVKPDIGYVLDKLTITAANGKAVNFTENSNGTFTYTQPSSKVTISATFKPTEEVEDEASDKTDNSNVELTDILDYSDVSALLNTKNRNAYVSGIGNDVFSPNTNMTRAEATQMFYNLLLDKNVAITKSFSDVPSNAWYAESVNTLTSLGIISGYSDGNFHPSDNITRAQFVTIIVQFAKISTGDIRFSDVQATHWAYDYINTAANFGWVSGVGNGKFDPDRSITRAEAVTLINRMLKRYPDKNYIDSRLELINFADVDKKHWAYYEIMEAANTHN